LLSESRIDQMRAQHDHGWASLRTKGGALDLGQISRRGPTTVSHRIVSTGTRSVTERLRNCVVLLELWAVWGGYDDSGPWELVSAPSD
jgi:hypothetical protein